ncbi:MAG: hypothetical protein AABX39_02290 [Nanoarchaeota archaeon]
MTTEYSKNSKQEAPKTLFESLLEKTVKGAENLPDSVSLKGETSTTNPFDWKGDCRYFWKANFPYSPPKQQDRIRRYIVINMLKKYSSL